MVKDDRKPARLEDVAAEAGLSPAAVSRYLSGKLSLPAATSERIDEAVRKLAYKPNPHASGLSRGRADAIGLVVPDIANPFFARLAAEIEREVDALGLALVLGVTLNRAGRELEYIERLRRNHVDSLIFMTNHVGTARLAREINAARSVVLVDEDIAGTNVPKVFCDNERGGYLATRHLIEAGHRRLGFVGGNGWRGESFAAAVSRLVDAGRPVVTRRALSDGLLWAAYERADATVFPSLNEGYGLPVAESLLAGTPVVTSGFGSMREIAAGGGALLVDPRDDRDIADAIDRVLFDEETAARLRAEARRRTGRSWSDYSKELWSYLVEN